MGAREINKEYFTNIHLPSRDAKESRDIHYKLLEKLKQEYSDGIDEYLRLMDKSKEFIKGKTNRYKYINLAKDQAFKNRKLENKITELK